MKKTLIITGGSKGIGHAISHQFAQNNWQIINLSRTSSVLKDVMNIHIDLSETDIKEIISDSMKTHLDEKQIICLVHNASYHVNDTIQHQNPVELTKALNVSILSPSTLNQILIPHMTEGSSVIYIGSTLSEKAVPNAASYAITKHAIIGMMRATCQDLAHLNIHSSCICPGFTNTEMLQAHLNHNPDRLESVKKRVGANRLIEPSEIADVVYFVAHHPVMNGSVIHANLGQLET